MRSVRDIPILHNIPVIVRGALNVPIAAGSVTNAYRLQRALPTLAFLAKQGARVVLISHLGEKGTETLAPVAEALAKLLPHVSFCPTSTGHEARAAVRALLPGHTLVLENLRRHPGEVMNDQTFAKDLAHLGDVFVQDSFDTCHRVHASIVGIPKFLPAYAGLLVEDEVHELTRALTPTSPSIAVIGGAKFSTKEPVLETLVTRYDQVMVGGALANDFLKAAGHLVGKSLVGSDTARIQPLLAHKKIHIPTDVAVVPFATPSREYARIVSVADVTEDDMIIDVGPETITAWQERLSDAETILWNGPLGNYERGFTNATDAVAKTVAASGAHSVVGGGDTIASIERLGLFSKFSFVSTGGGAMLDFIAKGTLPGIEALI